MLQIDGRYIWSEIVYYYFCNAFYRMALFIAVTQFASMDHTKSRFMRLQNTLIDIELHSE